MKMLVNPRKRGKKLKRKDREALIEILDDASNALYAADDYVEHDPTLDHLLSIAQQAIRAISTAVEK